MANLESVFIKEFKRNIRGASISKDIYRVPLPKESDYWKVSGSEVFAIKGILEEGGGLFAKLNRTLVRKIPKGAFPSKRKVDIVSRDFVRDDKGRFVYESVKIPNNSVVVISSVNLNLPYKYKSNEEGFGYIDFIRNGSSKEFLYYIPKKYLYLTYQTALALSVKNMKNFFGMGYQSWRFGTIYLHIIPYRPNQKYIGSKILKTSHKINYEKEVKQIVDFWVSNNIIPDIGLCNTINEGNLVLKETSKGYESYEPIEEMSLAEKDTYIGSGGNYLDEEIY